MSVETIEGMRTTEYFNWIRYFEGKDADRKQAEEVAKGNVLAMDEDQMIGALTDGN